MKLSRNYLLGVGTGLILSAFLTLALPPQGNVPSQPQGGTPAPSQTGTSTPAPESISTPPAAQQATQPASAPTPSAKPGPAAATPSKEPAAVVISSGATAGTIADQLVTQGLLSNKEEFLIAVNKRGVAGSFNVGTYTVPYGLTVDEVIDRLIKR